MVTTRRSWPPKVPSHDPSRPVAAGVCCAIARLAENPAIAIAANNKAQVQATPGLGARPPRVFVKRTSFMPGDLMAFPPLWAAVFYRNRKTTDSSNGRSQY
jgi:hypothetical protein